MRKKLLFDAIKSAMVLLNITAGTVAVAQQGAIEANWQRAVDDGSLQAYIDFVLENPRSIYVDEAICRIGQVDEPRAVATARTAAAGLGGTGTGASVEDCRDVTDVSVLDYSIMLATDTSGRMFNI